MDFHQRLDYIDLFIAAAFRLPFAPRGAVTVSCHRRYDLECFSSPWLVGASISQL